jgi:hypothetical protein
MTTEPGIEPEPETSKHVLPDAAWILFEFGAGPDINSCDAAPVQVAANCRRLLPLGISTHRPPDLMVEAVVRAPSVGDSKRHSQQGNVVE